MIKHILSIIWNQRRSNGWIFAELLVVAGVFWLMVDMFYVDTRTYYSPLGFDITNVWRFKLSEQERNPSDSLPGLSEPEKLTAIKGMTSKRAQEISNAFNEQMGLRRVMEFLAHYDLSAALSVPLYRRFGANAMARGGGSLRYLLLLSLLDGKFLEGDRASGW